LCFRSKLDYKALENKKRDKEREERTRNGESRRRGEERRRRSEEREQKKISSPIFLPDLSPNETEKKIFAPVLENKAVDFTNIIRESALE